MVGAVLCATGRLAASLACAHPSSVVTTKNISRNCQEFPAGQNSLHWPRGKGRECWRVRDVQGRPHKPGAGGKWLRALQGGSVLGSGAEGPEVGQSRGAGRPPCRACCRLYRRDVRCVLGKGTWREPEAPGSLQPTAPCCQKAGYGVARVSSGDRRAGETQPRGSVAGGLGQGGGEAAETRPCVSKSRNEARQRLPPAGKPRSSRKVCTSLGSCLSEIHNMCSLR